MEHDSPALIAARAWIGTPYVLSAALRGVGCDCIGLVRGVWSEVTGKPAPPPPPWRADWANASARPLVQAARQYLCPVALEAARPGDVVVLRLQGTREAHCGILERSGQFIHAQEGVGVVCVPFAAYRAGLSFAARFPSL
jgi:NlpC/P60 family putative phage cell wall peptidase